ncbi:beta-N-acetylglucosaminidase domain-containing protein [Collinsella sp. zg1085]|uniref:beta-N-acetylglucosaminidase domain-containing protein n=1 Tax=Collinsella sp. zg1085 TaxID=2844380 RepID=UPI001C0E8CDE|nr:beta-N-acetylglucosaminidase domain-containing protein [Collinsella sp. zg1085]QWT17973.1 beta-N-acetylglucosaminidase domain-containing protein [Collinsella sp. zg1085]
MIQKSKRRRGWWLASICIALIGVLAVLSPGGAHAASHEYQVYPSVQKMEYKDSRWILRSNVQTVVEAGVDDDTKARLDEVLALKNLVAQPQDQLQETPRQTRVLVGIHGSGGVVDAYVQKLVQAGKLSYDEGLFDKTDAYLLASIPGGNDAPDTLLVLGRNTDASFYGLTTLFQIFQQVNGLTLESFVCQDFADVVSRGFIEGYYGNPWTTKNRVNLMHWGGYYKLNAYVYAPKDDPKHRTDWRDLYTDSEIQDQLAPQAKAGNASKVRFVYALAPFHDSDGARRPFRFNSEANYQADLQDLKAKYKQTIDAGVRQIALLADDSRDWGKTYGNEATYLRILNDLTSWIHELQAQKTSEGKAMYEGLKDTILYCPALYSYTGAGEAWYKKMPPNVQVVMTGGRTFGISHHGYAERFKANTERAPFLWINWPCTDMARNFSFDWLTMGGHNTFLKSDVVPGDLDGIMLNPMQQSEPSKQGIFMMADYSWKLWESEAEADQAWRDSFSYIEHNSPVATVASDGLRDLSANMQVHRDGGIDGPINDPQYDRSNKWWKNNESNYELGSTNILETLTRVAEKLRTASASASELDELRLVYEQLGVAAREYREGAGDQELFAQMEPFVGSWDDTARAACAYVDSAKAALAGDAVTARTKRTEADEAYTASQSGHKLDYLGRQKDARVGLVVVTPTLTALKNYTARVVNGANGASQPTETTVSYTRIKPTTWATHDGEAAVTDNDESTFCWFQGTSSDTTPAGASVTVTYPEPRHAREFTFVQTTPDGDAIQEGTFEYMDSTGTWHTIGAIDGTQKQNFALDAAVDVKALRVTNTRNLPKWWKVYEIGLTEEEPDPSVVRQELQAAIDAAHTVSTETLASWIRTSKEAFTQALTAAEAGINNNQLTPTDLKKLAQNLRTVREGVKRYADTTKAELEQQHKDARAYTPISFARYERVYQAFLQALDAADNLAESRGKQLAAQLNSALNNLVVDRTEHDRAELALADSSVLVESEYSADSWARVVSAKDALKTALVADVAAQASATEYVGLRTRLEEAIAALAAPDPNAPSADNPSVTPGDNNSGVTPSTTQPLQRYKVTFLVDGRVWDEQEVQAGEHAHEPQAPAKEGWTFRYWAVLEQMTPQPRSARRPAAASDVPTRFDFTQPILGHMTLSAFFTQNAPASGGVSSAGGSTEIEKTPVQPSVRDEGMQPDGAPSKPKSGATSTQAPTNKQPSKNLRVRKLARTGDTSLFVGFAVAVVAGASLYAGTVAAKRR